MRHRHFTDEQAYELYAQEMRAYRAMLDARNSNHAASRKVKAAERDWREKHALRLFTAGISQERMRSILVARNAAAATSVRRG